MPRGFSSLSCAGVLRRRFDAARSGARLPRARANGGEITAASSGGPSPRDVGGGAPVTPRAAFLSRGPRNASSRSGIRLGNRFQTGKARRASLRQTARWRLTHAGGELSCERLVLAVPAGAAGELLADIAREAARALEQILARRSPCCTSRTTKDVSPSPGRLRPPHRVGSGRGSWAPIYASSIFPGRAPAGRVLLTVFLGGAKDPGAVALTDEELLGAADADLRSTLGTRGEPHWSGSGDTRAPSPSTTAATGSACVLDRTLEALDGLRLIGSAGVELGRRRHRFRKARGGSCSLIAVRPGAVTLPRVPCVQLLKTVAFASGPAVAIIGRM